MMTQDQVKDRIRKLLAVANNHAATDGEIENALRAAVNLMAVHRIEEHEVRSRSSSPEMRFSKQVAWCKTSRMTSWECLLACFISEFITTVWWFYITGYPLTTPAGSAVTGANGKRIKRCQITFYGLDDDARLGVEMFHELQATIVRLSQSLYGGTFRSRGRSYSEGFVSGLRTKLRKANAQLASDGQSRALCLRSNEIAVAAKAGAAKWLKESSISLKAGPSRTRNTNDHEAWHRGRADGAAAEISTNGRKRLES